MLKPPARKSGQRVAVIGGGPAGLGCAAELAQLGHEVVVFEKKPQGGGLNTYGIAFYKMAPQVSLAEVAMIQSLGVEFRCGVEVGRDIPAEQLQKEFDALFLGLGLGKGARLNVPGEDLPGVIEALEFIEQVHTLPLHQVPMGDHVAVIGGGNTATRSPIGTWCSGSVWTCSMNSRAPGRPQKSSPGTFRRAPLPSPSPRNRAWNLTLQLSRRG